VRFMIVSYWRRIAAPIIARVLEQTAGRPESEVRAGLLAAYPFGPRKHHPYRIWRDEIRIQTGKRRIHLVTRKLQGRPPAPPDPLQGALFQ